MFKKILLYVSGPGVIMYLGVVLFIHFFSDKNLISWIIPAIVLFFIVFLPIYAIENFKSQDRKSREKNGNTKTNQNDR